MLERHISHESTDWSKGRRRRGWILIESCILGSLIAGITLAIVLTQRLSSIGDSKTSPMAMTKTIEMTSTTTALPICGFSCLNETRISTSGLLAKWNFDGTFNEATNTYPAVSVNNPTFITNGYVRQGLFFNQSANQYLYTTYIPLIKASFTVEVWVYPIVQSNQLHMGILGLCTFPGNDECLHLTMRNINSSYLLYISFFGDGCLGSHPIPMNEWNHFAFTFENSTCQISAYLNGKLTARGVSVFPLLGTPQNVTIGYIPKIVPAYGNNFFHGYMDHLTISNRAKSDCEILDDASLTVHQKFDTNQAFNDTGPNSLETSSQFISSIVPRRSDNGIFFSTLNSSVQIDSVTHLGITNRPFSISFWIRPTVQSGALVFMSESLINVGWCMPLIGFAANGSIVTQIWTGSIIRILFGPILPVSTSWYHIVQTWSSTSGLRLYIDHTLVASDPLATVNFGVPTTRYIILANKPNNICTLGAVSGSASYSGGMDDFRLYSRELDDTDVCTLYLI